MQEGFSTATISLLAQALAVPDSRVLAFAGIPDSTYHARKRKGAPLSVEESSHLYRIAKVAAAADDFFENDEEAARRWLTGPKVALGGATPIEFACTPEGSE